MKEARHSAILHALQQVGRFLALDWPFKLTAPGSHQLRDSTLTDSLNMELLGSIENAVVSTHL